MIKLFRDRDSNPSLILDAQVAVIGYGNQGRVQALNLRDTGVSVIVGARQGGKSNLRAQEDGFDVQPVADAVRASNVVVMLTPDAPMKSIYEREVAPNLAPHSLLVFAHGFNIYYRQIVPNESIDVGLVSPKGQALGVRQKYVEGTGLPALAAIEQDATGEAWNRILSYAWAIGCLRAGAIQTSFRDETECDLFGEQAVLCGGIPELIRAGFETLVNSGYAPEVAYLECLHETKLIVDLIVERGLTGMRDAISDTAAWGGLVSGRKLIDDHVRGTMQQILGDIQSERFANEYLQEMGAEGQTLTEMKLEEQRSYIEQVGSSVRSSFELT